MNMIPHYVREFNAASMVDAVHAADQALREDSVTVAVWRDRVDALDEQVKEVRQNRQKIIAQMKRDVFFDAALSQQGDARLMFNAQKNSVKINNTFLFDVHKIYQKIFFGIQYRQTNLQQIGCMNNSETQTLAQKFRSALGYISYQVRTGDQTIHQDYFIDTEFYLSSEKLFFGGGVRTVENVMGEPTVFFETEAGDNPYSLPSQSMAFMLPEQARQKSAWHKQGEVLNKPRLRFICDLSV